MTEAAQEWKERAIACAFGLCVALLAWASGNSSVFPFELWGDVAVAAGIRPPETAIPGLWAWLASKLFAVAGLDGGVKVLRALGPVSLGVLAALTLRFFAVTEPDTLSRRMVKRGWSRRIARFVLMQGAALFALSYPVWRAGRVFSADMMHLMLAVVALGFLFKALATSQRLYALLMAVPSGLLAADTPIGFLPMALFPLIVILRAQYVDTLVVPFANPLVRVVTFRRMTGLFLLTWLVGVVVNMAFFKAHDGLAAHDWNSFTLIIHYLNRYAQLARFAATPVGWVFIVAVVLVPFTFAAVLVHGATDDDEFLPYLRGILFAIIGVLAVLQSAGWQPFWFWRWVQAPPPVASGLLLCLCLLATSITATAALCVFGVEIYFRNYRRIALIRYQDAVEDGTDAARQTVRSFRLIDRVVRAVVIYEPILLALIVVPFKFSTTEREMGRLVGDYCDLVAEECGDARQVFTDGALDVAIEVAAARRGRQLKALSMMAASEPYDIYLRTRGETDEENRNTLAIGAADAMRTWVRDRPDCATNIAVQLGFELWRHDKLPMPECGGTVARTAGFESGGAEKGAEAARRLAKRILDLYEGAEPMAVADSRLQTSLMFVQWRIARMCRMRADAADRAGQTCEDAARRAAYMEIARAEDDLADRLDRRNAAYARIRRNMDWVARQKGVRLTPREGLRIGLERADFRLARTFAQQVLVSDPYDTRANFAMGMGYFTEEMYGRAEHFLKRALVRHPNEPAVLNNLSIVQMKLGRLDEAETNATKALKNFPSSQEIKKTLDKILKAKSEKL